jgi:hypothetical protein
VSATGVLPTDAMLARLERRAVVFCGVAAVGALAVTRGDWRFAAAVAVGGGLMWLSYRTIRGSIEGLVALATGRSAPPADGDQAAEPPRARAAARHVARFVGRYALLGFLAYVSMSRLRLHPVGLIVGVTSAVAAAFVEAAGALTGASRPGER